MNKTQSSMLRQFSSQHPTPLMLLCLKKIFLMAKKLSMLKHQYIIKYCLQSLWVCVLSRVPFFATLWTLAHQSPLSLGFTRQEHWSGLLFPSLDLPHPEIQPAPVTPPALAGRFFPTSTTCKAYYKVYFVFNHNSWFPRASLAAQ